MHDDFPGYDPGDFDDLGVYGGNTYLPFAGIARQEVLGWAVRSVGKRPEDWLARDLLHGSLARDKRVWQYHRMRKGGTRPSWTMQDTDQYSDSERKTIANCRILHFSHLRYLHVLREHLAETAQVIARLWHCWPTGFECEWHGEGTRTARDVCDMMRLCPFCLTRGVVRLYRRILSGPLATSTEKLLLSGRLVCTDALLGNSDLCLPLRARITRLREQLGGFLRREAVCFGASGGILVFQMGPQKDVLSRWENGETVAESITRFSYRISILAEVTNPTIRLLDATNGQLRSVDAFHLNGNVLTPHWHLSTADKHGLRRLLVGNSFTYRGKQNPAGDHGVFELSPWFISSPAQWNKHFDATRNLRLFNCWGNWVSALPARKPAPRLSNAPTRRGRYRRTVAFREKNGERRQEAEARRQAIFVNNEDILLSLMEENGGVPGRICINRAFADAGRNISDRDARWIVKELKSRTAG